jgi:hypothetical protein
MRLHVFALVSCVFLCGCGATSLGAVGTATGGASSIASLPSVLPSPSIFSFVGKSDTKVGFMGPAALLSGSWQPQQQIISEQCRFGTADPMFFVPTEVAQKGWAFAGRLNSGENQFQVNEYRNVLTLGLTGAQQLNTWPVSLVALSDFPRAYLEPRLAMVAGAKLDAADQKRLAQQYIANAARINEAVERLERTYDPRQECLAQ